jgi:hypothetical protein
MSLLNDASLVMIPSGYKDGKLYSQKPTDGDGDFTFSRGSNLAATRVNSEGLIEKGRENLLLQSNGFNQAGWGISSATLTSGQSGYDGSSNAWLLDSSSEGYLFQYPTSSNVGTLSIYAKANSVNNLRLRTFGASINAEGFFDLANGVVGSSTNLIDLSIESIGGGWYRCSVVYDNAPSLIRIYPSVSSSTSSGTIGSVYIQDAQLEVGLVSTDVITTTTTTAQAGILEDMPRLDYSGGASCPSLLLEPQRSNLFDFSEYFEGSYWGKTQQGSASVPVVTGNYAISPEGVQNATRVQFDAVGSTSSDRSGLVRDFAFTSGTTYSISCWVKATSGNNELVQFRVAGAQVGGEQTATDEWQLFTATHTATVSTTDNFGMQVRGNNTTNESDILIYGMQLEQASYPTSYIPTYGGSSVTRSEDACSKTGISSLIGQTEGVVFVEFDQNLIGQSATRRIFALNDGTTSNRITAYISSTNKIDFYVRNSGGDLFFGNSTLPIGNEKGVHKIACAYKDEDYAVYMDGDLIISGTGTAGTIPACSRFDLGQQIGANDLYEPINQALLFKTRLTNDELAELTTL